MRTEAASYVILNTYHDTTCGHFQSSQSILADHCIKLHDEEYGKSMEYTATSTKASMTEFIDPACSQVEEGSMPMSLDLDKCMKMEDKSIMASVESDALIGSAPYVTTA